MGLWDAHWQSRAACCDLTFQWPHMLWLTVVPVLAELMRRSRPSRKAKPPVEVQIPTQIRRGIAAGGRVQFRSTAAKPLLAGWRFWIAFLLVTIALARPQFGRPEEGTDNGSGEIIIALDLSRSMLAKDTVPTRLDHARAIARSLVEALPDRKIGLLGFAGTAHLLAPPSEDRALLSAFLLSVGPDQMLPQGTNFAALADVAGASFSPDAHGRALVVITDGEAEPTPWHERIASLRRDQIHTVTVRVGTTGGAQILDPAGQPLRNRQGTAVVTHARPDTLRELSKGTNGDYLEANQVPELAQTVRSASLGSGPAVAPNQDTGVGADRFQWFLLAALALLVWSAAVEWPAKPRLRRIGERPAFTLGASALLVLAIMRPQISGAAPPLMDFGEEEPLKKVNSVVARLVTKRALDAHDYLELADAAINYGQVHRGHGHPISEGVLRDGLVAVRAGRRLNPRLTNWDAAEQRLKRLLVPPPPAQDSGNDPADPANEPLEGRRQVPLPSPDSAPPNGKEEAKDDKTPLASRENMQSIGGSRRDVYDPAEWRNPSLIQPLYLLEKLRDTSTPAELFRRMQQRRAVTSRNTDQTW